MLLCIGSCLVLAGPALAADEDLDTIDDSVGSSEGNFVPGSNIAIVDTGDGAVGDYSNRLAAIGHTASLIPLGSDYSVLSQYDMVILPTSHGSSCCNGTLSGLAADYHQFVSEGGCLYVGQPNPFNVGGGTSPIPWVPYDLTLSASYDAADCPPTIVDPSHCTAEGVSGSDLPFPGDTVVTMGPEWEVVTEGGVTGRPGLFTAASGNGNVLVELAHPSPNALCPYSDAGFENMVTCCLQTGPIPVKESSWGAVKTIYR
jgi:hypothetical protein